MFDMNQVSELLQAILLAVLPVLAVAGVRWLLGEVSVQKAKLTAEQQKIVEAVVKIAVLSAEQLGLTGKIREKKAYALSLARAYLADYGINIDLAYLDSMIEAAVLDEFNRWKSELESESHTEPEA